MKKTRSIASSSVDAFDGALNRRWGVGGGDIYTNVAIFYLGKYLDIREK
jgi:hypothetical protein